MIPAMIRSVAIVVSTFPPYRGGMGNAAADQARLLSERGFDVTVFTPDYGQAPEKKDWPFQIEYVKPVVRFGNAAFLPMITRRVRGFDAVLLHYPFFGAVEAFAFGRRFGQPLLLFYHMDAVGRGVLKFVFSLHRRFFLAPLLACSAHIFTSTESYAQASHLQRYWKRIQARWSVVPFCVDTKRFEPQAKSATLLTRYGLSTTQKIVLFVGSLDSAHYFKGVDVLLEAWARVIDQLPEVKLLIVGDGNLRASYEARVKKIGLKQNVVFSGAVTDDGLASHYALADLVVFPSVDKSEAFGLVALEAMASAKPVIASRLPGVESLVRDGQTGFLVPPKDSSALAKRVVEVLNDPVLVGRLSLKAREVATREYSEKIVGDRLAEQIRTLRV